MLEPADNFVIAHDTALPGLRTLLDPEAFAEALGRLCPAAEVTGAAARYLRYKPRTSCLVAYDVHLSDGQSVGVYARCHAEDGPAKLGNVRQLLDVPGPLGPGIVVDRREGVVVFVHPNDYEVRGLRKLYEPDRTPWRLRRIVPAHPHLFHAEPEALRYKPERRFVGKLAAAGGPPVAIRLYADAQFHAVREKAWAFRGRDELRVPRVVGDAERYSALALEWIDDPRLSDAIAAAADPTPLIERVGRVLASLHAQRPRLGAMYSASDYCRMVRSACAAVEATAPELGRRAFECFAGVQELIQSRRWMSRAVHGDFTPEQTLVGSDQLTVLDFDRAGYGDPGMDLGAFSAGLIALAVQGVLSMAAAVQGASTLSAAYRGAAGAGDEQGDRAFTAGALLMMAPEPFRHRKPAWRDIVTGLLDCAERTLVREPIDA